MTKVQEESHKTDPGRTITDVLVDQVTEDTNPLTGVRHPCRDQAQFPLPDEVSTEPQFLLQIKSVSQTDILPKIAASTENP